MDKIERINKKKNIVGSRHTRKLKKYSDNFNTMFNFYLASYRADILTFCGVAVNVNQDANEGDAKYCFRLYDNGFYHLKDIKSRNSNLLKAVIVAKKAWGLWVEQWCQGIVECSFTKEEILEEFSKNNITIPKPLMREFDNLLYRKKIQRNDEYLLRLRQ